MLKKIWQKNKLFFKYCAVGAASAVIDFSILIFLTSGCHIFYLISATISFVASAFFNYFCNRFWTFQSRGKKRQQLPVFFSVAITGLLLNNFILFVGVEFFHLWYVFAKVIATAAVTFWNFFGNKNITFNDEHFIYKIKQKL